jgi:hypothetical protein
MPSSKVKQLTDDGRFQSRQWVDGLRFPLRSMP